MYCFYCLMCVKNGGIEFSYKNALNQTVTGNVLGLVQINLLLGILGGNGTEQKYYCNGRQIGMNADTCVGGTYVCHYHLSGDMRIG